MADQVGNDGDGLLLLELGIDTDESEFEKAKLLLEDLRGGMEDLSVGVDLGGLISGLRTAATVLKGIVDVWNSLENKALDVSFTTNDYISYNLSPGQRQNISNRLSNSKVAANFGLTDTNVFDNLDSIIKTQAEVMKHGKLNDTDATSLQQLGMLLGNPALQGSNLAGLFTNNSVTSVYETLTSALADAYRLAYSKPENSKERENILQYIKNVEKTPFISPEASHYIGFMTEPNSPDYARSGNPMYRFFNSSPEDEGVYLEKLQKRSANAAANAEDLNTLTSEIKESTNQLSVVLYNALAEDFVIPGAKVVKKISDTLSGKKMFNYAPGGSYTLEAYEAGFVDEFVRTVQSANKVTFVGVSDSLSGALASHFGLSSNWVENADLGQRAKTLVENIKPGDALSTELAFYELMRLGNVDYAKTAQDATVYAMDNIVRKYGKTDFKQYKKQGELYSAIAKEMTNPNSKFYMGDGGILDIYAMMYENDLFDTALFGNNNTQRFLDTMAEVFKNTKMSELGKYYGFSGDTDITKAKVVNVGTKKNPDFRLRVTIEDKKTNTEREETYTSDELIQGIKATF